MIFQKRNMTERLVLGRNNRVWFVIMAGFLLIVAIIMLRKDHDEANEHVATKVINSRRDSFLVRASASDITKAEWTNAAGRKEALSKEDQVWHYAGMEALDSIKSELYFQQLTGLKGTHFSQRDRINGLAMTEMLTLYGNNMVAPTKLTAFVDPDDGHLFLVHSTDNPDNIFISDSSGIYQRIFGDLRQFWPNGQ